MVRDHQCRWHGQRVRLKRRLRPALPGASPPDERDLSAEHDDLARAAAATGLSLRELLEMVGGEDAGVGNQQPVVFGAR